LRRGFARGQSVVGSRDLLSIQGSEAPKPGEHLGPPGHPPGHVSGQIVGCVE
jgi:hypothetical protein